jgi:hypothetical protein
MLIGRWILPKYSIQFLQIIVLKEDSHWIFKNNLENNQFILQTPFTELQVNLAIIFEKWQEMCGYISHLCLGSYHACTDKI